MGAYMTEREIRLRRTQGSGPPSDLAFGEGAFSDADKAIYVGRFDEEEPPVMFPSDFSTYQAAIAALLLNDEAQDTAIAALAASSFSGAYGDLSGRPTIPYGFTYDQQAEPSGPAAGATWRERSAGGLIVGEWEWTGSVWCSLHRTTVSSVVANGAATAYPTLYFEAPRCLFVQCRVVINPVGNPATPFDSSNYREVYLARGATGPAASVFGYRPLISLAQGSYVSAMSYLNPSGAPFFTQTAVAGSPGTMNAPGVSWVYREVRA